MLYLYRVQSTANGTTGVAGGRTVHENINEEPPDSPLVPKIEVVPQPQGGPSGPDLAMYSPSEEGGAEVFGQGLGRNSLLNTESRLMKAD